MTRDDRNLPRPPWHGRTAGTVEQTLGLEYESLDKDHVVIATDVTPRLFQPFGVVHGGVYVLMCESAASVAASLSIDLARELAMGMEINANHLRPARAGRLRASARPIHRGRSTHVYHCEVHNDDALVCVSRCTVAIRPRPDGAAQ
ncbi:MAG: PaaI family thioesterase [Myxococcales bacterium]|nr:PaaI family thioesterase [Myxococcales bacterium]